MKKIAFIGAGSLQFTTSCVRDLLTFPAFKNSEFAKEAVGEHVYNKYITAKNEEWTEYSTRVSQWEIDKCLGKY